MKKLFDEVSYKCSKITTKTYSTSFSFGILALHKSIRKPIYNIYGFVRFADEIVDSFHDYDKSILFNKFKADAFLSIDDKISLNPILNSFQETVNAYSIDLSLINNFLDSMEMDLSKKSYNKENYNDYIHGSAEVVGLMCLKVFLNRDEHLYNKLKPSAMSLGSAFQKINFLRDANVDYSLLGRSYFPDVQMNSFSQEDKLKIEKDIEKDFKDALVGIKMLPSSSRGGVYLSYLYYYHLFRKIKFLPSSRVLEERIRIPNIEKIFLMFKAIFKNELNLI
ncbi:MAG: squalene/phytoene synthase family protein [Flavobacteriales bacterium]|nr:squalene/phytoene synthase family protein [Flavobacteriales bacterium]